MLAGREGYDVGGQVLYEGQDLLAMSPEDRAATGVFRAFQHPVEIPDGGNLSFRPTARHSVWWRRGLDELDAIDFLGLAKKRMALIVGDQSCMDQRCLDQSVNEGFAGSTKKRNAIFQMALSEPKLAIWDKTHIDEDWHDTRLGSPLPFEQGVPRMPTTLGGAVLGGGLGGTRVVSDGGYWASECSRWTGLVEEAIGERPAAVLVERTKRLESFHRCPFGQQDRAFATLRDALTPNEAFIHLPDGVTGGESRTTGLLPETAGSFMMWSPRTVVLDGLDHLVVGSAARCDEMGTNTHSVPCCRTGHRCQHPIQVLCPEGLLGTGLGKRTSHGPAATTSLWRTDEAWSQRLASPVVARRRSSWRHSLDLAASACTTVRALLVRARVSTNICLTLLPDRPSGDRHDRRRRGERQRGEGGEAWT